MSFRKVQAPQIRRILLTMGLLLLIVLFLGNLLARRLLIFSPRDLIVDMNAAFTQTTDTDHSLAVFAQRVDIGGDVEGYGVFGARAVRVSGSIAQDATLLGSEVTFEGDAQRGAVLAGAVVRISGTLNGETVVLADELIIAANTRAPQGIIACVTQIDNRADVTLLPCNDNAGQAILNRAGTQLASVWLVSTWRGMLVELPATGASVPLVLIVSVMAVAALLVVIFPQTVQTVDSAVRLHPLRMTLTGGLVVLMLIGLGAGVVVLVAYAGALGLLFVPLYALLMLIFLVLLVMGWVTLTLTVGGWVWRRISAKMLPPVAAAVIGGSVLALFAFALSWLPLGALWVPLVFTGLGLAGLGASYTTRLGRRALL